MHSEVNILYLIIFLLVAGILAGVLLFREIHKVYKHHLSQISFWHTEGVKELTEWRRRGGFTQEQISAMHNQILTAIGRDLNEMQVLSIMKYWHNESMEGLAKENEFIDKYVKAHKW